MQYVKIKGFEISKFTLGTAQLGLDYGIANNSGKPDRQKSFEILNAAVEGGINTFDTAMQYGDSEEVLGSFFTSGTCSLNNPVLITKFKISAEEDRSSLEIEKQIYSYVEESLHKLKIKQLPIYMIHNARDIFLYGKVISNTFKKLIREGLIHIAAVSVYTSEEAEEMLKYDIYDAIQIPMNILDGRFITSGVLKKLHLRDKIIFVRSVFLQGLILLKPETLEGNLKDAEAPLKMLEVLSQVEGMSIAQLALSYIRDMEEVTSLVMGVDSKEQVVENIQMIEGRQISEKTRDKIKTIFRDIPLHILNPSLWKK